MVENINTWFRFYIKKLPLLLIISIICGVGGVIYAWLQKPVYTAKLVFAVDSDNGNKLGSLSGLASQFLGVELSGGSVFMGDNIIEFLKTRSIIEKTLLTEVDIEGKKTLLVDRYIQSKKIKTNNPNNTTQKIEFGKYPLPANRLRDSLMNKIIKSILENELVIFKPDKKLSFINATMKSGDEYFAKAFIETLTTNAINYYTDYKLSRAQQNVDILQKQVDSVENNLTYNVNSIATSNDLNVNPSKQIGRAYAQRKQIDVQVNGVVYGELLKNLELSKMALRKETPLIQVIDKPVLPLEKKKLGRLLGGILFAALGFTLTAIFLFVQKQYFSKKI